MMQLSSTRMTRQSAASRPNDSRTILGLPFFLGSAFEAVKRSECGGLVAIPAAPALTDLGHNARYHEALHKADLVLPDSGFMVLVWNFIESDHIRRVSGLAYLRALLPLASFRRLGNTVWVLPNQESFVATKAWLKLQGIDVPDACLYIAPRYSFTGGDDTEAVDPKLLDLIDRLRPQHVVLGLGGGTQEPLGADLKHRLSYLPAIHCVGAATAFLTGSQVRIPVWADRLYMGWLFRCLSSPGAFGRRYWYARHLYGLMMRFRDRTPMVRTVHEQTLQQVPM